MICRPARKFFPGSKRTRRRFICRATPIDPIGVYFSPKTRNFFADEFIASYRGILILLMQKHLEFQIVTPRTLADFRPNAGVARCAGAQRRRKDLAEVRAQQKATNRDRHRRHGIGDPNVAIPRCPGKAYEAIAGKRFRSRLSGFAKIVPGCVEMAATAVHIQAGAQVATSIARTPDGHMHCFFANFAGLSGGSNPVQTPQTESR